MLLARGTGALAHPRITTRLRLALAMPKGPPFVEAGLAPSPEMRQTATNANDEKRLVPEKTPEKQKAGRLCPALRTEKLSIAELSQISFPLTSL